MGAFIFGFAKEVVKATAAVTCGFLILGGVAYCCDYYKDKKNAQNTAC